MHKVIFILSKRIITAKKIMMLNGFSLKFSLPRGESFVFSILEMCGLLCERKILSSCSVGFLFFFRRILVILIGFIFAYFAYVSIDLPDWHFDGGLRLRLYGLPGLYDVLKVHLTSLVEEEIYNMKNLIFSWELLDKSLRLVRKKNCWCFVFHKDWHSLKLLIVTNWR